jgi:hypothetical protein
MDVLYGSTTLTAADRFPFTDEPYDPNEKKTMKSIWENDPAFIEAK